MYHYGKRNNFIKRNGGILFSILFFVVLIICFMLVVNRISQDTLDRQEKSLNIALNRNIVSCYCVEGTYPPSLEYIVEHYGLTYDADSFFVDYRAIGSNIYPEVTVIRKGGR